MVLVTESNQFGVFSSSLLRGLQLGDLLGKTGALALENNGGDQTLDFGSLGLGLLAFLLGRDNAANNDFANIVFLGKIEELTQLAGTLGSETTGNSGIGETRKRVLASLDNGQREGRKIRSNDTTTDGLALTLTSAALTEALVTLTQEEANTVVKENTLHHRETLLIITTSNLQDVSLPLVTKSISLDFLGNALIVEDTQLTFIDNLDQLLAATSWISNVKLHINNNLELVPAP